MSGLYGCCTAPKTCTNCGATKGAAGYIATSELNACKILTALDFDSLQFANDEIGKILTNTFGMQL